MYEVHTKQFHISRDVVFKEDVFCFQHLNSIRSALFPVIVLLFSPYLLQIVKIPPLFPYFLLQIISVHLLHSTETSLPVHFDASNLPTHDPSDGVPAVHVISSDAPILPSASVLPLDEIRKPIRTSRPHI